MTTVFNDGTPVSGPEAPGTTTTLDERIARLDELIDSGATTIVEDGQTVSFDQDKARVRVRELKAERAKAKGAKRKRPQIFSLKVR